MESYRCDHPAISLRARVGWKQLASGDVVFTHGRRWRDSLRPWRMKNGIAPREYAGGIAETETGEWLVSTRESANAKFALKLWKPGAATMQTVIARNGTDLVEPVVIAAHERPRRHPSALHDWDYANLLALDVRVSRDGALKGAPASVRLETQDAAGKAVAIGTAPVEADGSFFVKTPADRRLGLCCWMRKGGFAAGAWMVLDPARRATICVGCHAGPEHAAENRVPEVLLRTTTPVDLTGTAQHSMRGGN